MILLHASGKRLMNRRKLKTIFYKFLSKHPNGMVKSLYNHVLGNAVGRENILRVIGKKERNLLIKKNILS